VERLTHGWSDSDWHRGSPGRWTSGQIFEHLRLTFTGTTKAFVRVMDGGKPLARKPNVRERALTFSVTKLGVMPSGGTAPKHTVPHDTLEMESMRRFYDALVAMDATLADAERRFGNRVAVMDHPFLGPLSTRQWRQFHRTHARHHLRQIARRARTAESVLRDRELSH
jgi:hypothetical protein